MPCPLFPSELDFVLVLDRIQDPGNLGTLLRTALAADVNAVWLGRWCRPPGDESVCGPLPVLCCNCRINALAPAKTLAIPLASAGTESAGARGRAGGGHPGAGAATRLSCLSPYWDLDWTLPTALVLGTEGAGLHPDLQACCTHAVTLPHSSRVESLNVASAAVPLLLERRRATMTATSQQFG